ncbi:MAG: hypothetical protein Tsb0032_20710 [Kiloniellaceae bacterium]
MKEIIKKHRQSFKALGYTDEQADDLIHRLSAIMSAFIDAAWGVHPTQLARQGARNKSLSETPQYARIGTKAKQSDDEVTAGPPAER